MKRKHTMGLWAPRKKRLRMKNTHTFGRDEVGKPASEEHGGTDDVVRKMLTEVLIDNARLALFFAVPCPDMEYQ
ncbi:unnamed protein product [Brassica rapa subsp. trilocularis]